MLKSRKFSISLLGLMLLGLLLAACGDSTTAATTTGASTTTAGAPAAATTASTGATTSAGGTTSSTTTSAGGTATTASGATTGATTAASSGNADILVPANVTEIPLDPATAKQLAQTPGIANLTLKFYSSDAEPQKLADDLNALYLGKNYKFSFPGATAPVKNGPYISGLYTSSSGGLDVLSSVATVADFEKAVASTNTNDADRASLQNVLTQLKNKKSVLVIFAGQGLLNTLAGGGGGGANATPAAPPTTANP